MHDSLPQTLYSAAQVRELDRIAIQDHGIPGYDLMQRAAAFSYECLKEYFPDTEKVLIVCGGGNNAGDGYELAALAAQDNKQVTVANLISTDKLSGDAKIAFDAFIQISGKPETFHNSLLDDVDVIVDAIFGTGLDRDIEGEIAEVINAINAQSAPVMALDIPSGLHADHGIEMGVAISADITPTFIGLKKGMFTNNGPEHSGTSLFNDLDVPKAIYDALGEADAKILDADQLLTQLPLRHLNSHKGHFGHVLIIGGDEGYIGAARLAAEAALRVGAGLVSVATRESHAMMMNIQRPEIMAHGVETAQQLKPLLKQATVIVIGPGLGQSDWAQQLFASVLERQLPMVIDADALNLMASHPVEKLNSVLTPHPGEAARLLDTDTATIQHDRFSSAQQLQDNYKGTIVLKGCGTIIADQTGGLHVCTAGNPGMATGGMGDVLSGLIGGLMAQQLELDEAAKLGVLVHATAADLAITDGERGLLASDLFSYIRKLVNP
ncbi:MAG: NAD(P)H-hydrate dehydratase [Pseudomonadota bacterium]